MLKRIRIANARYRHAIAEEAAANYNSGKVWHVTVQTALNIRRDRAAAAYASALLS